MPIRRKAVLFDLDGTLVDSAPDLAASLDATLVAWRRAPLGLDAVRPLIGDGARALLHKGFQETGGQPKQNQMEEAVAFFLDHYRRNLTRLTRPFPGVPETLDILRNKACRLAVCTNKVKSLSMGILDQLELSPYFDAVIAGDSYAHKKPHPAPLLGALESLGSSRLEGVMVGDSSNDVQAAKAAGMPVLVVSFGYTATPPHQLGGDRMVNHFAEIPRILEMLE